MNKRTFLKGLPAGLAGLALVSPFWSRLLNHALAQEVARQRLLVWYVADGTVPEWFWPAAPGALAIRNDRALDLASRDFNESTPLVDRPAFLLQPIAAFSDRTLLVKGLNNPGAADHAPAVRSVLTGEAVRGEDTGSSPSLDTLMTEVHATAMHAEPVLRTGVYGDRVSYAGTRDVSRPRGGDYIEPSWQPVADARRVLDVVGGAEPVTSETNPRRPSRLAALGAVRQRVETLRCAAGTPAAQRLEAYVEEVARLERLEGEMRPVGVSKPLVDASDAKAAAAEEDIRSLSDIAPFVRDLAATALALNYSPAVTIQWGASGANKIENGQLTDYRYDFLKPQLEYPGAGDHGLAHPEDGAFQQAGHKVTAAIATRDRIRIHSWFFGQLNLLLERLQSMPDGAGTVLDNTTVLCVSEFGGPNANTTSGQHSLSDLPYLMVAGANTPFRTGQCLTVDRTHGDYLLTLARGFGSSEERMGVGTGLIDGILR